MKGCKTIVLICLIVCVLAFATCSCKIVDLLKGKGDNDIKALPGDERARGTFGAKQFEMQLTAIASMTPSP